MDYSLIHTKNAAIFIAESLRKHTNKLCIITFGPLTNLALGFHMWQGTAKVSSVRICGGTSTGAGNVKSQPSAEGNFFYDPEAAHIVLSVSVFLCRIFQIYIL